MAPNPENSDSLTDATPVSPEHLERIAETFDREYPRLLKRLLRRAPRSAAEEIAATSFAQLLKQPYASVSRLAAYVRATAENLLFNYYRDTASRRSKLTLLEPEKSTTAPSPEAEVIDNQLKERLAYVIDHMDPELRLALQLRLYEDLSTQEIGEHFAARGIDVTERTIQRYLEQAIEICRQALVSSEEPKWERSE